VNKLQDMKAKSESVKNIAEEIPAEIIKQLNDHFSFEQGYDRILFDETRCVMLTVPEEKIDTEIAIEKIGSICINPGFLEMILPFLKESEALRITFFRNKAINPDFQDVAHMTPLELRTDKFKIWIAPREDIIPDAGLEE